MRHLFDRPLGACAPNGSLFKCGAEALALGGDLASALIGGWFSSRNTENAAVMQHNSNRILQKWQQAYTQQNMADQYKYDMWAWNENNQYNSPRAQMERARQAGLNPYLSMPGSSGVSMSQGAAPNTHVGPQGASASSPAVQPAQMPRLNAGELIMQGSQIKNQQIQAFAELAKAAPELINAVGEDAGTRILESAFGQTINNSDLKRVAKAYVVFNEAKSVSANVKAEMDKIWEPKEREQNWAAGEQAISESFARIGQMASEAKLNEAKISELASEIVRNVAEAWKLRKEGDKYVADTKTVNALRQYVVSQAKSHAQQLKLSAFMSGADPVSPIHDLKYSKDYVKDVVGAESLKMDRAASQVEYFLNKWLGEYLKVSASGSVTPSSGSTYNFNNY